MVIIAHQPKLHALFRKSLKITSNIYLFWSLQNGYSSPKNYKLRTVQLQRRRFGVSLVANSLNPRHNPWDKSIYPTCGESQWFLGPGVIFLLPSCTIKGKNTLKWMYICCLFDDPWYFDIDTPHRENLAKSGVYQGKSTKKQVQLNDLWLNGWFDCPYYSDASKGSLVTWLWPFQVHIEG